MNYVTCGTEIQLEIVFCRVVKSGKKQKESQQRSHGRLQWGLDHVKHRPYAIAGQAQTIRNA